MKINENFVLRNIADTWAVLPLGAATLDFNGMITLNETATLLWSKLDAGCERQDLIDALLGEYDVTEAQAAADVDAFIEKLKSVGCIIM